MSSILLLTSSPRSDSLSTTIATDLADKIKAQNPGSDRSSRPRSPARCRTSTISSPPPSASRPKPAQRKKPTQ